MSAFAEPQFELTEDTIDDRTHVITVTGEIHVSTAPQFSRRLSDAIGQGKTAVVLDLADVTFIDSTGLSVLLSGLRRVTRSGGRMAIVCTNPTVLRLFEVTRLDTTFEIVRSRDEAVRAVRGGDGAQEGGGPDGGSSAGAP
jgi:anti-sigma B factor antagonist